MAQKTFGTYSYTDYTQNVYIGAPPLMCWKEHWNGHTGNITFRHFDGHVAYYFENSVQFSNASWKAVSDLWRYIKYNYGFLGQHHILYIVLHTGNESIWKLSHSKVNDGFCLTMKFQIALGEEERFSGNFLIDKVVTIIKFDMPKLNILPEVSRNNFMIDILVYDIYLGIKMKSKANKWMKIKETQTKKYPLKNKFWLRDWYLPLYINFRKTKSLQNFFTILYLDWIEKKEMNIGEFVHFWSGAVHKDLQSLAMETFGWRKMHDEELLQARKDYPQLNSLYTPVNSSLPQWWTRNWETYSESTNSVYFDDQIACYSEPDYSLSLSKPCYFMSNSWRYAKEKFGPLSNDPILFIHFTLKTFYCRASKALSYFDQDYRNRNVIECGKKFKDPSDYNFSEHDYDHLMVQLGLLVLRNARETGNWPGFKSSGWSMVAILVYDIYKGLGMTDDANRWREKMFKETEEIPFKNSFWFRDWYFPIYQKYGGAFALNRFLSVINARWPQEDQDYIRNYSLGEMVHFWSIAAGENLWSLADKAFGCCAWNHQSYLIARKEYPNFNYTDQYNNSTVMIPTEKWIDSKGKVYQDLSLVYVDLHVAVYFDPKVDVNAAWPFQLISKSWRYAKKIYGPFEPNAIFHLLILSTAPNQCTSSRFRSYQNMYLENRTVLTCGVSFAAQNSKDRLKNLMYELSSIVLREAKQTGNWPAKYVSRWEMRKIIAFDILYEMGSSHEAITTINIELNDPTKSQPNVPLWTKNWFYPIYANHGGAIVLNNFLNLLSKHWKKVPRGLGYDYTRQLNIGAFVHFWSGAAGVNLTYLANRTFCWHSLYSIQLDQAIKAFPMITYINEKNKVELNPAKEVLTEDKFGHSELLLKIYDSSAVSIYFDSEVNRDVKWVINLLTEAWNYTKLNYGTFQNSLDRHLNIFLHGNKHVKCKSSLKLLHDSKQENILDCGKPSNGSDKWAESNPENRFDLIIGFAKLIQHSARQTGEKEAYDPIYFSKFLAFDIFLRLGNFKDAHRLLQEADKEKQIKSQYKQFTTLNWYLPLYTTYGGVALLSNFTMLLSTTWAQQETLEANQKINVGQNIHFWSASAGTNLNSFAYLIFGRNHKHQVQFSEARKEFPLLHYYCYECDPEVALNEKTETRTLIISVCVSVGIACVVFAAILIPLVIYRKKFKLLQQEMRELTADEIKHFFEGSDSKDEKDVHFCIESKPFNMDYEIPREHLEIDWESPLGSGQFGMVFRGTLQLTADLNEESVKTLVAVKTVKPNVSVTHFKTILTELKVMGYLGLHANIVSLVGACTVNIRNREVYMALEFCCKGDLLSFMKFNRTNFVDWIDKRTENEPKLETAISKCNLEPAVVVASNREFFSRIQQDAENATVSTKNVELQIIASHSGTSFAAGEFSTLELLKWSREIASGMDFITSKNVIHGDLAARNVLLTEDNVAKISDFGLSRNIENYAYYMKTSKTPVPWRWMAIESLRDMKFSVQSDAWSFGVVLYEMFSLGTMPYAGWSWDYEFIDKLVAGHRLSAPEFGNEGVYQLMMDCMHKEASERITFSQAIRRLEEIKVKICQERQLNTTSKYLKLTS